MPNYLTPEGAKKLATELNHLLTVERPRVVAEVRDAAAQGDRSENAEYIYGKRRLAEIDRRIRHLGKRLESAEVVRAADVSHGEVRFGATVEVEDEHGQRRRYLMVGPDEANPAEGKVSFHAPLGRALLNRRVGDRVTVRRPAGDLELEILAIDYE
jgi:transcription elongation factor GreB